MYEFNGFGKRVQKLRKDRNITQEELADRVGVSGQAVSKWENDQSYPDITLIPTLAGILGTDIEHLFGKKEQAPMGNGTFPEMFEGLTLVHISGSVACYSNKNVVSKDQTGVKFADGSLAELTNNLVVNNGAGEIRLVAWEDMKNDFQHFSSGEALNSTETTKYAEFDQVAANVDIAVLYNECFLVRSSDGKARVRAKGNPKFIQLLRVQSDNNGLKVDFQQDNGGFFSNLFGGRGGGYKENKVIIEVPYEQGKNANIRINGSGFFNSEIALFETGNLAVNGSGTIEMLDFTACSVAVNGSGTIRGKNANEASLAINGSGDIEFENAQTAKLSVNGSGDIFMQDAAAVSAAVNGSGDIHIGKITGGEDVSLRITGSGDIEIKDGQCEKFSATITGSGDIDASGLTANNSHIILRHSGSVTLGRVIGSSTEQVRRKGKITILNRG